MNTQQGRPLQGAAENGESAGRTPRRHGSTSPDAIQLTREDGRPVAAVCGGVLRKRVHSSRHFLRTPPAIAFDAAILSKAAALGADRVEVEDLDTGAVYSALLASLQRHGFTLDRGAGRQIALALPAWNRRGPGEAVQMQLF